MADEIHPHSVQPDMPARPPAESREETIGRVLEEADEAQNVQAREELVDPTSRRGVNRTVAKRGVMLAAVGAVFGAVLALILSFLPGPVETDTAAGTIGYMVVVGIAFAIIFGLIGTLILLAREDGRVEREVERATGHDAPPPASPSDPKHDVEGS
ncbi:MAG TPA: hypothetical protein VK904_02905 [Miltoncostaeaceae bacterium]|nr:hypothetical protein [Miltoncostaeaceae bacterium]